MLEDTIKMLNSDESLDLFRPEKYRKIVTHMWSGLDVGTVAPVKYRQDKVVISKHLNHTPS